MINPELLSAAMVEAEVELSEPTEEEASEPAVTEEETDLADNSEEDESEGDVADEEEADTDEVDLSFDDSSESESESDAARWADQFPPDSSLDPAVQERFRQQLDGVQKVKQQEIEQAYGPLVAMEQRLLSPESFEIEAQRIAEALTKHHGKPVRFVVGDDYQTTDDDESYELPEVRAVKEAQKAQAKEIAELKAILGTREQEERQAKLDASWLASKGQAAVKLAATLGLNVTPEEALKAIKAFPNMDPKKAINAEYGLTHKAAVKTPKKGGPVMPKTGQGVPPGESPFKDGKTNFRALAYESLALD